MPFGQLVVGSPGAGKSTYCDGSTLSSHSIPKPAVPPTTPIN